MEILWTGLNSVKNREFKMIGNTSIWMFPIYGMMSFLAPIVRWMKDKNAVVRGGVYTICIFTGEFFTGTWLKKQGICPWDYSKAKLNVNGVIRLDYAPVWFAAGLFFEKLLKR